MQYAVMAFGSGEKQMNLLMAANELQAVQGAMESDDPGNFISESMPSDDYEEGLGLRVVYGCYKPQADCGFPQAELYRQIEEAKNVWLAHLDGERVVHIGIEDVVIHKHPVLRAGCGHNNCSKLHKTKDVAFSALVKAPKDIDFGSKKTQGITAFVRYFEQMDVMSNVLERMGVFCFKAEERRFSKVVTSDNWKSMCDSKRAVSAAQLAI